MRRFSNWLSTLLVVAAVAISAAPATAQEKSDQELAEETFNEGAKAYLAGDYSEAVVKFLTAYEYKENAMILYNLSLAYAGMGNWERAIEAATRADARADLPEKVRPRNTARVVALQRIVTSSQVGTAIAADIEARDSIVEPTPAPYTTQISGLGWTGVGAGVLGLGALGYAVALELSLADKIATFEEEPTNERKAELETDQQFAQLVLFSGAGLLATGIILLVVDYAMSDATSIAISPVRGGANVDVTFRF